MGDEFAATQRELKVCSGLENTEVKFLVKIIEI